MKRMLVIGLLLGTGGSLSWLAGVYLFTEWERRHAVRAGQRPYLFDTIEVARRA